MAAADERKVELVATRQSLRTESPRFSRYELDVPDRAEKWLQAVQRNQRHGGNPVSPQQRRRQVHC
jgi:hypothetical protein